MITSAAEPVPPSRSGRVENGAGVTLADLCERPFDVPLTARPMLCVVVDTEEEFDWGAPLPRNAVGVRHLRRIDRLQGVLDQYKVRPTYVVDFPVASQADGVRPLKAISDDGRCLIGAHLHPWVTPPFDDELTRENSFACNLGVALERAKLERLKSEIEQRFEVTPRVYKAGRYGFGSSTARLVEDLGFDVDQSIIPYGDFRDEGGPSFESFDAQPFFFGRDRLLLELPCTCAFLGAAGAASPTIHRFASSPAVRWARLTGICARLRLADKLMLSPEGYTLAELRRLTTALFSRGCRTFTLTFHSPSIDIGHTPYVRSDSDLVTFMATLRSYFDFFFGTLDGVPATPEDLWASAIDGLAAQPARRTM